jgi:hypothetical protein
LSFAVKILDCVECKKVFTFTVEEQEYRCSRGYPNEPVRCSPCRRARNSHPTQDEYSARTKIHSDGFFR